MSLPPEPNPASGPAPDTTIRDSLKTPTRTSPSWALGTSNRVSRSGENASARKSDRGQSRREVLRTGDGYVLESEVCCWAQEPTHCHSLATPPWVRLQPSLSSDPAVRMAGKYGFRLTGHSLIVGQGCRRHGTSLVCTCSE